MAAAPKKGKGRKVKKKVEPLGVENICYGKPRVHKATHHRHAHIDIQCLLSGKNDQPRLISEAR